MSRQSPFGGTGSSLAQRPSGRIVAPPRRTTRNRNSSSRTQNVATFDSAMRFANLIGSMKVAFSELRSASVTPRATLQAPQTKTGTFPLILATSSGSGGNPKP
jgi:hypothetical protein